MALVELAIHRRRSGPVFLDRDGEIITHVYETEQRQIVIGEAKTPLFGLPSRSRRFVIDSSGVTRVKEGSGSPWRWLAVVAASLAALVLLRRLFRPK